MVWYCIDNVWKTFDTVSIMIRYCIDNNLILHRYRFDTVLIQCQKQRRERNNTNIWYFFPSCIVPSALLTTAIGLLKDKDRHSGLKQELINLLTSNESFNGLVSLFGNLEASQSK
jgi:hypothetical protein